jgi:nucleoside-diphosphate-sugar epimerase
MAFYLVTGGAGFIGSNIVHELVRRGDRVRVIDNFSTGKRENLSGILDRIELLDGDLRNPDDVHQAVSGIDCILHQAALPSVPRSIRDPVASNESNVSGTVNLLTAAKDAHVKRLVFASSSSVYGDTPTLPKTEDMPPNPRSPYAVSKAAGEYYCRVFFEVFGLKTVILRYFNIFGSRQDPASPYSAVIPLFIAKIGKGERPVIFGDGTQSRDFTFVENAVRANLLAVAAPDAPGKTFNIAGGKRHSLNDLVEKLNKIIGTALDPSYAEARRGDIKHSLADISLAKRHLGYEPLIDFEEGLRKTFEWYTANL